MKHSVIFILTILLVSLNVSAKGKRKPNQITPNKISIQVSYGDRTTNFEIDSNQSKNQLIMRNNLGANNSKPLSNEDVQFVLEKIASLPKDSNDPRFCLREFIRLESGPLKRFACLGGRTKISEELLSLVNLLSLQF